jgi:hypothetical protein
MTKMSYRVSVKFGEGQDYEFRLQERDLAGSTPESARRWLTQQFHDMGCSPSNPTGKVLLVDKILAVARAMGDQPFARNESAAQEFARNALIAFEKRSLSVDLSRLSVG